MAKQRTAKKSGRADGPAPTVDVYVGLLLLSVAALIVGITCLWFQMNAYGWQMPTAS